jgi:hypothetical protein
MISERKLAANRKNALRSTDPRTAAGKARSSRNAFKHGLAICICQDVIKSAEIERLAEAIVGDQTALPVGHARAAAEAQLELNRVREYRTSLIRLEQVRPAAFRPSDDGQGRNPTITSAEENAQPILEALPILEKLQRYERRAFSRRKRQFRNLQSLSG